MIDYRILGPLEVSADGRVIDIGGPKQRALLVILILRANEPVPRGVLVDELWGERPPGGAQGSLDVYVSRLRKALGAAGNGQVVMTRLGGYCLQLADGQLDVHRFERLVAEGRRALARNAPEQAAASLRKALQLWRGNALGYFSCEPFAQVEAGRLEEMRLGAIEDRIEADLALGRHADLVSELEALVATCPLRERLHGQLMLALYRCGRQGEALGAYQQLRTILVEELGIEPSADLRELHQQILAQDPALTLASPVPVAGLTQGQLPEAGAVAATGAPAALAALATAGPPAAAVPVPRQLPADVAGFTGREVELAELDLLLPAAELDPGGGPGPVVISAVAGTAGVGKTALAIRWAHRATSQFPDGQLYVNLRGYDPGQPVTPGQALAGFLRALGVADAAIPAGEADRAAAYRSLLSSRRVLVVLDNAGTTQQVRPLLPGTGSAMVVVTSRDSLAGLVAVDGARRLDLDLLPLGEAVARLGALIGPRADADPAAAGVLAGLCARLPLALRVAAGLATAQPEAPLAGLVAELAGEDDRLDLLEAGGDPHGAVTSVFSWSYRHLTADAAKMFRLLGLHPAQHWDRYAAAALTATTSLAPARRTLAELAQAHLIQPAGVGRYQMHDLLRGYAASLAGTHDSDQAQRAVLTRLFDYYLAACAAAMDCLDPATRPWRPDPPQPPTPVPGFDDRAAARAWLDAELPTLVTVAAHAASHGWPGHVARLGATLPRYLYGGRFAEGITIETHALKAARDSGDRTTEARVLATLGILYWYQGGFQRAADCQRQSLGLATHMHSSPAPQEQAPSPVTPASI